MDECYARAKKCLSENKDVLENIAKYLLEVETLNKQDILEIVDTGNLKWWEDKKLADKEKNLKEEKIQVSDTQEVTVEDIQKAVNETMKAKEEKTDDTSIEETNDEANETVDNKETSEEENKEE